MRTIKVIVQTEMEITCEDSQLIDPSMITNAFNVAAQVAADTMAKSRACSYYDVRNLPIKVITKPRSVFTHYSDRWHNLSDYPWSIPGQTKVNTCRGNR